MESLRLLVQRSHIKMRWEYTVQVKVNVQEVCLGDLKCLFHVDSIHRLKAVRVPVFVDVVIG